jgi:hypothetical protein
MMLLLGEFDLDRVRQLLGKNICGEMTVDN